ncbi:hypothetical protein [Vibrio barjaei]|uniref:hypothetical protein n=1 Tax=Vibrio barjaei TaxID=1676683 RepID=UPI0022846690|nr:hypothetical protein [Vibrio barjaei]MCY9874542.1 hypothetical protein [Vibrio barjaei]
MLALIVSMNVEAKAVTCIPKYFENLSDATGVPGSVVFALALQESATLMSDGSVRPWPYVINHKGKPYYYRTRRELFSASQSLVDNGMRSFDIGYFQVNWRWHNHRVRNLWSLTEPLTNGYVAMQIFIEQYNKHRNWIVAAGRYHNPNNNNGLAEKYSRGFREWLEKTIKLKKCA